MKRYVVSLTLMLAVGLALPVGAAQQDEDACRLAHQVNLLSSTDGNVRLQAARSLGEFGAAPLETLFSMLNNEDPDIGRAARRGIEWTVKNAGAPRADDDTRREVARALLKQVYTHPVVQERRWAIRQLSLIATDEEVPDLEALLRDDALRERARKALVRTPGDEAVEALGNALAVTDGPFKGALIDALGERGAVDYVDEVIAAVNADDPVVRQAAIAALGKLPAPAGEPVLRAVMVWDATAESEAAGFAYLELAETLMETRHDELAQQMFAHLFVNGALSPLRCGGLRGLADSPLALDYLLAGLNSPDPAVQGVAVEELVALRDRGVNEALVAHSGPPAVQALALRVLGERGADDVLESMVVYTRSAFENVRLAAIDALGQLEDPDGVPALLQRLQEGTKAEQAAVVTVLATMPGDEVTAMMIDAVPTAPLCMKAALISQLGVRKDPQASAVLIDSLADGSEPVRVAALQALAAVDTPESAQALVATLQTGSATEAEVAEVSLKQQPSTVSQEPLLELALEGQQAGPRAAALRVLGEQQDAELQNVFASLAEVDNATVSVAALNALARLQDPDSMDTFRKFYTRGTTAQQIAAANGAVKVIAALGPTDPNAAVQLNLELLEQAVLDKQRTIMLYQLSKQQNSQAIPAVLQQIEQGSPVVKGAAGRTLTFLAAKVQQAGEKDRAIELYLTAIKHCTDRYQTRKAAEQLVALGYDVDPMEIAGFFSKFYVSGVIPNRELLQKKDLFDTSTPPDLEQGFAYKKTTVGWQPLVNHDPAGVINLNGKLGSNRHCGAYLYAEFESDIAGEVNWRMGSDDDIFCWINGKLVHKHVGNRGLHIDGDIGKGKVRQGKNWMLLKVLQGQGGWSCVIRAADDEGNILRFRQWDVKQ